MPERCNGRDDDCDGRSDEAMPLVALGDPIVIRDETELDAGDCTSCFWAWSPILAPAVGGGWNAFFRISIYGGREEPNVFVRPLDRHGVPLGPNASAWPEVALDLRALDGAGPGAPRTVATCWRIGSRDVAGLLRLGPDGTFVRDVYSDSPWCEPSELAGDRVIAVVQNDLRAEVRSRRLDGSDRRTASIDLDQVYYVLAGTWDDRVGVVLLRIDGDVRALHFAVLSPLGETVVPPRPLEAEYDSYPRLVGVSTGWLLVMPGARGSPARRASLSPDGALLSPLRAFDDAHSLGDAGLTDEFVHHPTERTIAHVFQVPDGDLEARMHVQILAEDGRLLRAFEDDAPGTGVVASPSVVFADGGRILVAWHDVADDSTRNRVYVRELGCGR
jgi:hypothetical protein